MDRRVPASAIVDLLAEVPEKMWRVEVWGDKPKEERRVYTIRADGPDNAAHEGIRLFVEEMLARNGSTPAGSD